jgi:phosphodiesterase/alkaline phosphatase D-like protein
MKPVISKPWKAVFAQVALVFLLLTCFMEGIGLTGGKPSAVTKDVTSLSWITARLNGTVNPMGSPTLFYWEYGTTTTYGKKTSSWSVGSGMSDSNVYADIGNLLPNTTYHFRFVAGNSAGTTLGSDLTFTTTVPAPSVKTGPAVQVTAHSARLTGTVNPNGSKTNCSFQYGITPNHELAGIGLPLVGNGTSNVAVKLDLGNLHVNAAYHYVLLCSNSSGQAYGSDMVFKTKISDSIKVR